MANMSPKVYGIIFALLTALFWGMYGPALQTSRVPGQSPFKPFILIGVAYLVFGILGGVSRGLRNEGPLPVFARHRQVGIRRGFTRCLWRADLDTCTLQESRAGSCHAHCFRRRNVGLRCDWVDSEEGTILGPSHAVHRYLGGCSGSGSGSGLRLPRSRAGRQSSQDSRYDDALARANCPTGRALTFRTRL